jgi:sodium transport system permease protein
MRNIITIFKKEFYRVMSDRRLIFTSIILPGLAIYIMYSLLGNAAVGMETDIDEHKMIIYTENMPNEFRLVVNQYFEENPDFYDLSDSTLEQVKQDIKDGDVDLLLVFEEDFMDRLDAYQNDSYVLPNVDIYYNNSERYSAASLQKVYQFLDAFVTLQGIERYDDAYYVLTTNADTDGQAVSIEYENKGLGQGLAMLLPMLIVTFLFSGAMSIGPDSIAGEKERGTIATLLITPVKRSEIAIGKVFSLSVISLMSATSSFIGIIFSLGKIVTLGEEAGDVNPFEIYGISDFAILFLIILSTVMVIVGIISVVSAYAKTIKEASTLILPFYFVSIFVGVSTMFSGEAASSLTSYLIPIYSSVNMIIAILTFETNTLHLLLTVGSSMVYLAILIFILNKLFQSERVMFSK